MDYLVIDCFNFTLIAASVAINISDSVSFSRALTSILNKMITKICNTFPDYKIYGVWDTYGGTEFRKKILPEYKANRDNSRFDFKVIQSMDSVFEEHGVTNISIPECEADDAIYVLCKVLKEKYTESDVVIVSRDEDMVQVVQSGYANKIWDCTKKRFVDIPDYSIVDMKALTGDTSDNIKGLKGIGPKTALKILNGTKYLTDNQKEEFELYKSIIDASKHPRLQENYDYIKETIK